MRSLDYIARGAAGLLALAALSASAFNVGAQRWGGTSVTMHLQLGAVSSPLFDGATSWNAVAEDALAQWNAVLTNIQFTVVRDSTTSLAEGNGINNVFFAPTIYGDAWDSRTLGITLQSYNTAKNRYTETDVLFNGTLSWSSYRGAVRSSGGATVNDLRRVALHEFGHALGLNHPDDAGQQVSAIMNATTSNIDNLTDDDIAGGRAIYDGASSLVSAPTIDGGVGYSTSGATLNVRASKLTNQGNVTSGALRLELWAMPSPYNNGLPSGSRSLGAYALGPLTPAASVTNVDVNTVYTPPPGGTYFVVLLLTEFTGTVSATDSGFAIRDRIEFQSSLTAPATAVPALTRQPAAASPNAGGSATFTVESSTSPSYQWQRSGNTIAGATNRTLNVTNLQPASTGVYHAVLTNSAGATNSDFALLGLNTTSKVLGAGSEIVSNIPFANGNVFDQILLEGTAATFTADSSLNQITRLSFVDLDNDIVQIEFSGPGSVSVVLDNPSGPATPVNYNQPTVSYMKGHAGIVVTGATENSHLSVFSVGRANAFDRTGAYDILQAASATNNPANNGSPLFEGRANTVYDGFADIAFIAISSSNGKFGGLRTANAVYAATRGLAGVWAPGVEFTGPVFVGNIIASESATPALTLGAASDVRITGGDLLQTNARAVKLSGIAQLLFRAGSTSHGATLPAKTNHARLEQNGVDVTAQIAVNPTP